MTDLSALPWLLRGGFSRLLLWAVDAEGDPTGESLSTGVVSPVGFASDPGRRTLDSGRQQTVSRVRAVAPELSRWADVLALRRWRHAGLDVRGVLVARGRGHHLLWDEAAPVLLDAFSNTGALSGDRLVLHSARFAADVDMCPDLLGTDLDGTWTGDATRVLPAPSLTVYGAGDDVTLEALDASGTVLATSPGPPSLAALRLPDGTFSVRITATSRPSLLTRLDLPASPVVATGTGGAILTSADGAPLYY